MRKDNEDYLLAGGVPLCIECGQQMDMDDFAFKDYDGVWAHTGCIEDDEVNRRKMSMVAIPSYLKNLKAKRSNPPGMSLDKRHQIAEEQLYQNRDLSTRKVSSEFYKSQEPLRRKMMKEYETLSAVNKQRLENNLPPVSDWKMWKRMGERPLAPLPVQKRRGAGGCLKVGLIIAIIFVALFFLAPLAITLVFDVIL